MPEWWLALGKEAWLSLKERYALPQNEFATSIPNPRNSQWPPYNVIPYRDGTFEAISSDGEHCIPLKPEHVVLHRWNMPLFCKDIARILGVEPSLEPVKADDRLFRLGNYRLSPGEEYPVYWLQACDMSEFQRDAPPLIFRNKIHPFFLLTGTRAVWESELQGVMKENNIPLLALAELLDFRDGQLVPTDEWQGAVDALRKALHPEKLVAVPEYQFARSTGWEFYFVGEKMIPKEEMVGFYYIQHLLRYPHELIYGAELERFASEQGLSRSIVSANTIDDDDAESTGDTPNYDGVLDREARANYRQRLQDLAECRRVARSRNDGAAEKIIDKEYRIIAAELAHSTKPHGETRNLDASSRNLSKRVAKNIDVAIERIKSGLPGFAQFLKNTIHHGLYSFYAPHEKIDWKF